MAKSSPPSVTKPFNNAASGKAPPKKTSTASKLQQTKPPFPQPKPPASVRRAVDKQVREQNAVAKSKAKAAAKAPKKQAKPLSRKDNFNAKAQGTLSGKFNHSARKR